MKLVTVALFALLAACADPEDYPPGGGGGGLPIGGNDAGVDGGSTDGGDGGKITGRVCLLIDFRQIGSLDKCDKTTADGLTVFLGTRSATTKIDGSFTIDPPQGSGFVWHVSGGLAERAVVRSAMPFGTTNVIPAMRFDRYADLVSSNGGTFNDQEGSIVIRILKSPMGAPVANISADTTLANNDVRLYDTATQDVWEMTATGKFGIAWIPSVNLTPTMPPTPTPVTLTNQAGMELARPSVTVENQTVTYITQEVP